jgi:hypothetical protein
LRECLAKAGVERKQQQPLQLRLVSGPAASDLFTKDVPREVVEVLGPMLTGEAAWPDTPESEDALKAQIADMRLCV